MKLRVQYMAQLRATIGQSEEEVELPLGETPEREEGGRDAQHREGGKDVDPDEELDQHPFEPSNGSSI